MGEFKLGADLLKYLTDSNLLLLVSNSAITNSRDRDSPGFQLYKVYRDVGVIIAVCGIFNAEICLFCSTSLLILVKSSDFSSSNDY